MNNTLETILKHPVATTIVVSSLIGGVVQIIGAIKGVNTEKK